MYIRVMCYRMSHNSKHHLTGRTSLGIKTGYLANITIQFRTLTVIIAIILRIQMVCKHSEARNSKEDNREQKTRKVKKKEREKTKKRNGTMILSIERAHLQLIEKKTRKEFCIVFFGSNNAIYRILNEKGYWRHIYTYAVRSIS